MNQRRWVVAVLAVVAAATGWGQNAVFAEYDGKGYLVRGMNGVRPCIELDGKVVSVRSTRYALKHVDDFLPVFVSIRNMSAKSTYLTTYSGGSELNNDFHFRATFESPYQLENVFLLLDMKLDRAGHVLFAYEVGTLEARTPKVLALELPLAEGLGAGQFEVHLFAGGPEVLHSLMPAPAREEAVDRLIRRRIQGRPDGPPQLFVGPWPEYPEALRKRNLAGSAIIATVVDTYGRPRDPQVRSASDPAFGAAALDAVRLWRFLPQIKNGVPVETRTEIPLNFPAPEPEGKH